MIDDMFDRRTLHIGEYLYLQHEIPHRIGTKFTWKVLSGDVKASCQELFEKIAVDNAFIGKRLISPSFRAVRMCAPSMGAILEVQVLSRADHSKRREVQLRKGDRAWGGSMERIREPMDKNQI